MPLDDRSGADQPAPAAIPPSRAADGSGLPVAETGVATMADRGTPPGWRILEPGRNCWRVARARRVAALVDGGPYFAHLEQALRQARRSILILGWDFDGRIRLRPDAEPSRSPPLGELLRSLVEARPELEVRILVWSVAVLHAPGASLPLILGAPWQDHPRIQLRLDREHPIYAAHHQKLVCIDDALAFAGGIDLTVRRWDTNRHAAADPGRLDPDGKPYPPVHDVQIAVDGEAARALAAIARERWRAATGEALPAPPPAPTPDAADPWPPGLDADFTDAPVTIARTMPAWRRVPAIREAAALTADALAAARRSIYIETQYLADFVLGGLLAEHLSRSDGPEVVILVTPASTGMFERLVMGRNRDRLIRLLTRADRFDRLRICYPVVPGEADGECPVRIHSKVIVVDDDFVRIGSSNLNNRSVGLDTECDLAVEAPPGDAATRRAIARLRDRLLAEHLGVEVDLLARTLAAEGGSLVRAIERLNENAARGLRRFRGTLTPEDGPTRPVFGTRLVDPRRPFEPSWLPRLRWRRR